MKADAQFSVSPLRLMVHAEFGLWSALRGALLFDQILDLPAMPSGAPA